MTRRPTLAWGGYLLHLSHYDPAWVQRKRSEKPFDLRVAHRIVDLLADQGYNMVLIGVSDGVAYAKHPELKRRYSRPMSDLRELADHAHERGLEVVPKLNFSKSEINCHDWWIREPGEVWYGKFDDQAYWTYGLDCIDEIIAACRPRRFFHIGMDEDHERSYSQYVDAIKTLRRALKRRRLRTICWSDLALTYATGEIYQEKCRAAEERTPKDIVRLLWDYSGIPTPVMRRTAKLGFEHWAAPGHQSLARTMAFRKALLGCGGTGLVMTQWVKCDRTNEAAITERIRAFAMAYQTGRPARSRGAPDGAVA
jgi:hypothetical protein